jgi:signal transduction histidine kinase
LAPLWRLAERQTDKMGRLVEAMLSFNFSRPEGGREELQPTSTDLVAIVQKVIASFKAELTQTGSSVRVEGPAHAFGVWDRPKLEQVVVHLLSNAIKFGEGKPIELTVEQDARSTTCSVQDHGIGIPADRVPYVFDRFERAVSARQYGGLGLGLFIVRYIVEAHGGHVRVATTEGAGTRICIDLPNAAVPA